MSPRCILLPFLVALLGAWVILATQGCDPDDLDSHHAYDRCVEREAFAECMSLLPAGPVSTHYSDWNEVVESCSERASWTAWRLKRNIPAGCR